MLHLLLALVFLLAGVCLPASPDLAAPAAGLAAIAAGAGDPVVDTSSNPDRDQAAVPADIGADGTSAPSDAPRSSENVPGDIPRSAPSRQELCTLLASAAEDNALPVAFFVRLIWQESGFDRTSVSSAGALGVAQFMPEVAVELGVRDPFDPREALPASAHLLRDLHAKFGNLGLAAAAYNAGPKRVLDWLANRSRLPKETRDYVRIVTGIPAEHWIGAKLQPGELQVPRQVPCAQVASSSEVPLSPQDRKAAGSRLRHPAAPAVEYMRAASPSPMRRLARHITGTARDHRGAAVVRLADLKTHAKRGEDDRRRSGAVRVADFKSHAKHGGERHRAS